jgi:hypothetical protein
MGVRFSPSSATTSPMSLNAAGSWRLGDADDGEDRQPAAAAADLQVSDIAGSTQFA